MRKNCHELIKILESIPCYTSSRKRSRTAVASIGLCEGFHCYCGLVFFNLMVLSLCGAHSISSMPFCGVGRGSGMGTFIISKIKEKCPNKDVSYNL